MSASCRVNSSSRAQTRRAAGFIPAGPLQSNEPRGNNPRGSHSYWLLYIRKAVPQWARRDEPGGSSLRYGLLIGQDEVGEVGAGAVDGPHQVDALRVVQVREERWGDAG